MLSLDSSYCRAFKHMFDTAVAGHEALYIGDHGHDPEHVIECGHMGLKACLSVCVCVCVCVCE